MAIVRGKGLPLGGKPVSLTPVSDGDAYVFNQALGEFTPQPVLVTNPDAPPDPACVRIVTIFGVSHAVWEKPRLYSAAGPFGASMWTLSAGGLLGGLVNNGLWDASAYGVSVGQTLTLDLGAGNAQKFGRVMVVHDSPPTAPNPAFTTWGSGYSSAGAAPEIRPLFSDNGTAFFEARNEGVSRVATWKDVVADLGGGKYAQFVELPPTITAHRYWQVTGLPAGALVYEVQWATWTDADDSALSYEVHAGTAEAAQLVAVIPSSLRPTESAPWKLPATLVLNNWDATPPWEDRWTTNLFAVCARARASGKASPEPFPWAFVSVFVAATIPTPTTGVLPKWDPAWSSLPSKITDDGTTPKYDGNPMFHDGTKKIGVVSDVGSARPIVNVSVAGAAAAAKLGSLNGDLAIMDGADVVVTFGRGTGGSTKQSRYNGPIFQDFQVTDASALVEAVRLVARSNRTTGGPTATLNVTTGAADGSDVTGVYPYHPVQVNVAAKATDVRAELGGFVAFLEQHGIRTTSIVPFDSSARIANDASGPVANMVGINLGLKNDYLGDYSLGNDTQASAAFARQASVGTSVKHGGNYGSFIVLRVDRPQWWDYTTGTITASAGSTITGAGGMTWTSVPKTGESGVVCLKGKWITWTATSGTVVSKRISSVTNNTTLVLAEAIIAGETALAGTAYRIVASDPWDAVVGASGLAASPAIDLTPEDRLAPGRFAAVMAVQTADPTTPATKFGWTWDGIGKLKGLRTDQASFGPPFVTTRASASGSTTVTSTTPTDIAGATVTFTPPVDCRVAVHFTVDAGYTSGSNPLVTTVVVNGTAQGTQAIYYIPVAGARATTSQTVTVDLTAGTSYTIKLQTFVAAAASYTVYPTHTGLVIVGVGKL